MIYVLTEQFMNGTVTINVHISGIEADSFAAACKKLREFENWHLAENITQTANEISYTIPSTEGYGLSCFGRMDDEPLKVA